MADRLTVDLDGLATFADTLESIRTDMGAADTWMLRDVGELGGPDVDDAMEDFESNWSDGRGQVDENCENLVKLARQAVDSLHKADDDLAKQLTEDDA